MKQRLTYMKYAAIIAVAVFSLVVAIPLSQTSAQPKIVSFKPVATKVAINPVVKPTATHTVSALPPTQPTTPAPTPKPTVILASYRCQAWAGYFQQYNWNANTAMAICQAESSGEADAVSNGNINPDGIPDYGLMQLHGIDILDPAANIAYAYYHKYLTQGWGAWSTFNTGVYTKYL